MNSSIEVIVVCVTGMVCDAIADALECDSINDWKLQLAG